GHSSTSARRRSSWNWAKLVPPALASRPRRRRWAAVKAWTASRSSTATSVRVAGTVAILGRRLGDDSGQGALALGALRAGEHEGGDRGDRGEGQDPQVGVAEGVGRGGRRLRAAGEAVLEDDREQRSPDRAADALQDIELRR